MYILYYPIRNGWEMQYVKNGLFYYKSIQDCRSYDLQNIGLKIHNFSLELKQFKTLPAASCWILLILVSRYVSFNPRFCKSWDCPLNLSLGCFGFCDPRLFKSWDYLNKNEVANLMINQQQSTYLRCPESAIIEILPFRPLYINQVIKL